MRIRSETVKNFHKLYPAADKATTAELAAVFDCDVRSMLQRLKRYHKEGYLTYEEIEAPVLKLDHQELRTIRHWSSTDKLREFVSDNPERDTKRREVRIINSVFALGRL